jgi:allophanate hydrolase subunit 1
LHSRQEIVRAIKEHPRFVIDVLPSAHDVSVHYDWRASAQRFSHHARRGVTEVGNKEELGLLHRIPEFIVRHCGESKHDAN